MSTATIDMAIVGQAINNKLQYVFKGLNWLHGKTTRYLVTQLAVAATIIAATYFSGNSLLALSPYILLSVAALGATGFLFLLTQGASEIEDNLEEIKEGIAASKQHLFDTKTEAADGQKFNIKALLVQTQFVSQLANLKDVSLDAKDGIASLIRVFTPFTAILFMAAFVATVLQFFAAIIAFFVFVF